MLTGDDETITCSLSSTLGLDEHHIQPLTHQKVDQLERLDGKLAPVGVANAIRFLKK